MLIIQDKVASSFVCLTRMLVVFCQSVFVRVFANWSRLMASWEWKFVQDYDHVNQSERKENKKKKEKEKKKKNKERKGWTSVDNIFLIQSWKCGEVFSRN